eukprot:XP_020398694.1 polyadenylate-binding protein RBP47 [Zea mays]
MARRGEGRLTVDGAHRGRKEWRAFSGSLLRSNGVEITSVKIIRNKQTGHSEGYGFIEFSSRAAAEHTLINFNGQMMSNVEMTFKLNWASASTGDKRGDSGSDHTIFVGDLAHGVTDSMLEDVFRAKYPSVRGANVAVDT